MDYQKKLEQELEEIKKGNVPKLHSCCTPVAAMFGIPFKNFDILLYYYNQIFSLMKNIERGRMNRENFKNLSVRAECKIH